MPARVQRALVSEQEFLALPESNSFIELLDGEVIVSPSPSFRHQQIVQRLFLALNDWNKTQAAPLTIGLGPQDIRFAKGRILQPDLFIFSSEPDAEALGPIPQIPILCVEVVSSNRMLDRVTKRYVYAESGVAEYWVVEQHGPIERYSSSNLNAREELITELTSSLLPGFRLDLAALFL